MSLSLVNFVSLYLYVSLFRPSPLPLILLSLSHSPWIMCLISLLCFHQTQLIFSPAWARPILCQSTNPTSQTYSHGADEAASSAWCFRFSHENCTWFVFIKCLQEITCKNVQSLFCFSNIVMTAAVSCTWQLLMCSYDFFMGYRKLFLCEWEGFKQISCFAHKWLSLLISFMSIFQVWSWNKVHEETWHSWHSSLWLFLSQTC